MLGMDKSKRHQKAMRFSQGENEVSDSLKLGHATEQLVQLEMPPFFHFLFVDQVWWTEAAISACAKATEWVRISGFDFRIGIAGLSPCQIWKILTASTKSQETALALIHEESRQVKGENIRTHMKNWYPSIQILKVKENASWPRGSTVGPTTLPSVHVLPQGNANMLFAWQELSSYPKLSLHVFINDALLQDIKAEAMLLIEQLLDRAFGFSEHQSWTWLKTSWKLQHQRNWLWQFNVTQDVPPALPWHFRISTFFQIWWPTDAWIQQNKGNVTLGKEPSPIRGREGERICDPPAFGCSF